MSFGLNSIVCGPDFCLSITTFAIAAKRAVQLEILII